MRSLSKHLPGCLRTFCFALIAFPAVANAEVRWSDTELAILSSLRLSQLPPMPVDPSNTQENNPHAIALGKRLFFDPRLSRNGQVACATCHDPAKQFQDGRPRAVALGMTERRTMPLAGAGYSPWLFWDGRKDSLWSHALAPLEDALEHGGNRTRYAHLLKANYAEEYRAVFGALPDLAGMPQDAGPLGSELEKKAWDAMPAPAKQSVSRVFANLGKAIAAYVKTLRHSESRLDRFVDALLRRDRKAGEHLNDSEQAGLQIFIGKGQCVSCHNGPLFTDHFFHGTRVPPRDAASPDPGRSEGALMVQQDEFNCLGPFSDAKSAQCLELRHMSIYEPALRRAFKTPSLRGVAERAPYMHAGQFASLREVVRHYIAAPESVPVTTLRGHGHGSGSALLPVALSEAETNQLIDFLGTLSAPVVEVVPAQNPRR
ncbi:MAG: cytochrome-c peroxidase [Betaproteobacteria bacterium]|nr:cytochrome-c peroxidase [Betaproteobacteria bacterium]